MELCYEEGTKLYIYAATSDTMRTKQRIVAGSADQQYEMGADHAEHVAYGRVGKQGHIAAIKVLTAREKIADGY